MACDKCEKIPEISFNDGSLIFCSSIVELISKMRKFLTMKDIDYNIEDSFTIIAKINNFKEFISFICESKEFSKHERDAINILFLENNSELSPKDLINLKSLEKYKQLLKSIYLADLIKNESLTVHFQPIIDVKTNTIAGYEALSRGFDEEGNLIEPTRLIEWAKQGDMTSLLDKNFRENALKAAATSKIDNLLFINFIPSAIYDPEHCLRTTVQWAKDLNIDPKKIVFEVIESDFVDDIPHLKNILNFYKKQGYMVALDDVGSGTASLQMIIELKPDIIKIDSSIVNNIHKESSKQSIFNSITQLAKDDGIKVLAEGVETKEDAEYCLQKEVDFIQGFYFARPSYEIIKSI